MNTNAASIAELRRATVALALELPGPVYDDYSARLEAVLADVEPEPAPAGSTIDRDAALAAVDRVCRDDLSDYYGDVRQRMHEALDALVRPVGAGVVFTREEASACAWALDHLVAKHDYDALRSRDGLRVDLRALAERLESAS